MLKNKKLLTNKQKIQGNNNKDIVVVKIDLSLYNRLSILSPPYKVVISAAVRFTLARVLCIYIYQTIISKQRRRNNNLSARDGRLYIICVYTIDAARVDKIYIKSLSHTPLARCPHVYNYIHIRKHNE